MGGKAMLWFSNRDGLKVLHKAAARKVMCMLCSLHRNLLISFKLSKEDAALLKEMEDNKAKLIPQRKKK
jgi:tricorn protease